MWNRRQFLGSLAAAGAMGCLAPAWSAEVGDDTRLKLGFDNFSIRAFDWKAPQLIDYAASLHVDTLLLSDLDVYESLDEDYLQRIRAQAERAGIELQAGTGSICPTSRSYNAGKWGPAEDHARLLIRTAKRLGTSVARCYLGSRRDREDDGGIERHIQAMVKVLKAVRSEAEDANVKLAVENHAGDMQAWELVQLIEEAGKSFVGATMDPGNATWTLEDPYGQPRTARSVRVDLRHPGYGGVGDRFGRDVHVGEHGTRGRGLVRLRAAVSRVVSGDSVRSGDHLLQMVARIEVPGTGVLVPFSKRPRAGIRSFPGVSKAGAPFRDPGWPPERRGVAGLGTTSAAIRSGRESSVLP
jgi:sugar phosphate isomerase/epimerase